MTTVPRRATGEKKFFDSTDLVTNVPTAGDVNASLCLVTQGTDDNDRIGRKIYAKAIGIRGTVNLDSSVNTLATNVRIIVFVDKQANGATAAVTDILASAAWNAYQNLDNVKRFSFLLDRVVTLNPMFSSTLAGSQRCFINWYKNINMEILYKANAGTVADLSSANIGVLSISDNANCDLDYISRLRFTDA